jgi:hypothetical protein
MGESNLLEVYHQCPTGFTIQTVGIVGYLYTVFGGTETAYLRNASTVVHEAIRLAHHAQVVLSAQRPEYVVRV